MAGPSQNPAVGDSSAPGPRSIRPLGPSGVGLVHVICTEHSHRYPMGVSRVVYIGRDEESDRRPRPVGQLLLAMFEHFGVKELVESPIRAVAPPGDPPPVDGAVLSEILEGDLNVVFRSVFGSLPLANEAKLGEKCAMPSAARAEALSGRHTREELVAVIQQADAKAEPKRTCRRA